MATFGHVILFSLLGGLVSLIGGLFLLRNRSSAKTLALYATPFAAGALLSAVFLDLLREGMHQENAETVLVWTLVGIVCFFFAERVLHWFHHHHDHEHKHDPTTSLIVVGDLMHNALDGVAIAAAFLVSVPVGIVTTLAVAAHEIPQEIGDFGLLLGKGLSRRKVLLINLVSALATTLFAIITFAVGSEGNLPIAALLGLSAGFLLYIAMSDVIPEIHEQAAHKKRLFDMQPLMLLLGVITVGIAIQLAHQVIDTSVPDGESSSHSASDTH